MERFITLVEPKVLQVTVVEVTGLVSGHYPYVQAVASNLCLKVVPPSPLPCLNLQGV